MQEAYGYTTVQKKDCLNNMHKRKVAALHTFMEKTKAQESPLGGRGWLTQDKTKKITN